MGVIGGGVPPAHPLSKEVKKYGIGSIGEGMKETPSKRIKSMSSLTEIATDQLVNRVVVRRGDALLRPPPPLSRAGFWTDI